MYPALKSLPLAVASLVVAIPIAWSIHNPDAAEAAIPSEPNEPSESMPRATDPFAATLIRAGLHPDALAAVGLTAASIEGAIGHCRSACEGSDAPIADCDDAVAELRPRVDRLRREVRSGLASEDQVAELARLKTDLEAAKAGQDAALVEIQNGICETATEAQVATLRTIYANRRWKFPVQYLVVERSEADWIRLRNCLGEERTAPELGDEIDEACARFLAEVRAHPAVQEATACLDANCSSVEFAWNSALSD